MELGKEKSFFLISNKDIYWRTLPYAEKHKAESKKQKDRIKRKEKRKEREKRNLEKQDIPIIIMMQLFGWES